MARAECERRYEGRDCDGWIWVGVTDALSDDDGNVSGVATKSEAAETELEYEPEQVGKSIFGEFGLRGDCSEDGTDKSEVCESADGFVGSLVSVVGDDMTGVVTWVEALPSPSCVLSRASVGGFASDRGKRWVELAHEDSDREEGASDVSRERCEWVDEPSRVWDKD